MPCCMTLRGYDCSGHTAVKPLDKETNGQARNVCNIDSKVYFGFVRFGTTVNLLEFVILPGDCEDVQKFN